MKKTTSMEERRRAAARAARRPASASAFTPSPNKPSVLSIVGVKATGRPLSSHPAARGIETALNRTTQSINSTTGPLPRKLRETPMRPGAIETKRVATRKQATAKPDMVFGPPRDDKMGRGDTHEERTHLAGTHAMAHSRIMRETARTIPVRPAVIRAHRVESQTIHETTHQGGRRGEGGEDVRAQGDDVRGGHPEDEYTRGHRQETGESLFLFLYGQLD